MSNTIRISHDITGLSSDILVMKDKGVLDDDASSDQEEVLEMENVAIAAQEKQERMKRLASHGKRFNPLTDDWDEIEGKDILDHYDDFAQLEKERVKRRQITLVNNEGGVVDESSKFSNIEKYDDSVEADVVVRSGHAGGSLNAAVPQQQFEELKFESDYVAQPVETKFKSVSKKKTLRRKKNSDSENEEMRPPAISNPLLGEDDSELHAQLARLRNINRGGNISTVESSAADMQTEDVIVPPTVDRDMNQFLERISAVSDVEKNPDAATTMQVERDLTDTLSVPIETTLPPAHPVPIPPAVAETASLTSDVKFNHGLLCALEYFGSRGEIEKNRKETIANSTSIERRDEYGRAIVNPKEAYKQLSWQFHGIKPGARKQEKRINKIQQEYNR